MCSLHALKASLASVPTILQATRNMAALAADMKQLRSFLHVSTAYVNCFLGRQKHVEERQYELVHNGKPMCHAAVIEELQSLAPDQAEKRVSAAWPEHHACNVC